MKTIIYRGYNKNVGWVRGTAYLHFNDRPFNADVFDATKRDFIFVQKFGERAGFVAVDPKSVSMATGIHDNYGNMIFEGDIVKLKQYHGARSGLCSVMMDDCGRFKLVSIDDTNINVPLYANESKHMKIVDNRYNLYDLKDNKNENSFRLQRGSL